jgi:adenylate cyclase
LNLFSKLKSRAKGKKFSEEMSPPCPPPETDKLVYGWDKELKGPMNVDAMNGIIDFSIATAGTNGFSSSSSPTGIPNFLLPSEFSNPFSSTPVQEKEKAPSTTLVSGPGSPTWVPPESWAVEKTNDDPYNPSGNPELSEAPDSGFDDNLNSITFKVKQPPPDFSYRMKIYRQDNSYHVVAIKLRSTVSELNARLARKLLSADDRVQYNLYLKERGQGTLSNCFRLGLGSFHLYRTNVRST